MINSIEAQFSFSEKELKFLETDFLGIKLINPFVLASAPPTRDIHSLRKGFGAGWAGAVTKSVVSEPLVDKMPRIGHFRFQDRITGSQNFEMGSEFGAEIWVNWLKSLALEFPDRLLIVSLFASSDPEEWKKLAGKFLNTGIHGFELNFSCPHSSHNLKGSVVGQNPGICAEITGAVREVCGSEFRIMPKLPYLVHPNEAEMCMQLTGAGMDCIAAINTVAGLCEFDIYTMQPKLNVNGKTTAGGVSYDMIRPFGRLIISNFARSIDWRRYPISAMGGVSRKIESMVEYFLLGANHLQVCSEVMNFGFNVVEEMKRNLVCYLNRTGKSLEEIRGCAVDNVVAWDELENDQRTSEISAHSCMKCYECVKGCMYEAIKHEKGRAPFVIKEKCTGCGSCYAICRYGSVTMIQDK